METEVEHSADANAYDLVAVIGKACHGAASVFLAKHLPSGNHVAVKTVQLDQLEQCEMQLSSVQHEVLMCRRHQHLCMLPVLATFVHQSALWVVTPLMGFGSCKDLLHAHFREGLPEAAVVYILRDVLLALDYLHMRGIIHRSVKASHITISGSGQTCLSGLRHTMCMLEKGNRSSNVHDFPDHYITSLLWTAPEVLQQNLAGYNTASDIYSVGITACELANGVVPFSDMPTTQMLLEKLEGTMPRLLDSTTIPELAGDPDGPALPYHRTFSPGFHGLVESCLQADSQARPTASQLLQHSFFKSVRSRSSEALPELLRPVQPLSDIMGTIPRDDSVSELTEQLSGAEIQDTQWTF